MADSKLTDLSENTAPSLADWLYLVDDDGGSPASYVSQKVQLQNLKSIISGLLAYTAYNPNPTANISTTSSTFADVDATNLNVTFTVPASGNVLIRLTAVGVTNSAAALYVWNLRTTGGSNVTGSYCGVTSNTNQLHVSVAIVLTGLTPGASITYRWGHAVTSNSGFIRYGDDGTLINRYGPAVMEVWAI